MLDEQRFFETFISLIGKRVEVGVRSSGKRVTGIVTNAMFDSFLLQTAEGNQVVRFDDLEYLDSDI